MTNAAKTRLLALTRELLGHWQETKDVWHDQKAAEFEKKFIDELTAAVNVAVNNLDALERVLTKVREECEPPR